jgi:hypothetical protein
VWGASPSQDASQNMVPPIILPLPVQQVAAAQRLGAFLKAYKTSLARTIVGAFIFLVAAALFCAGGIFPPELTVTTRGVGCSLSAWLSS